MEVLNIIQWEPGIIKLINRFGQSARIPIEKSGLYPGPGSYKINKGIGKESPKFTFRKRTKLIQNRTIGLGPAAYLPDYKLNPHIYS